MATGDYLGDLREVDHMLEPGPHRDVLRSAIQVLAENVPRVVAASMARELPDELAGAARPDVHGRGDHVGTVLDRWVHRSGVDAADARVQMRLVWRLLEEMLTQDTLTALRASLPEDHRALWQDHGEA